MVRTFGDIGFGGVGFADVGFADVGFGDELVTLGLLFAAPADAGGFGGLAGVAAFDLFGFVLDTGVGFVFDTGLGFESGITLGLIRTLGLAFVLRLAEARRAAIALLN